MGRKGKGNSMGYEKIRKQINVSVIKVMGRTDCCTPEAFEVSFNGYAQHVAYAWHHLSGTRALNTTTARPSCKAELIFGIQVNKFIQNAEN